LSIGADGVISGTLDAAYPGSTITFEVEVSDGVGPDAQTASSTFTIAVYPELLFTGGTDIGAGERSRSFTMTGLPLLQRLSGGRPDLAIVAVNGVDVDSMDFPVDISGGLFLESDGTVSGTIDPDLADDVIAFTVR